MLLFFRLGGLCAGTSGNRTRPRRSRGAAQEKTECSADLIHVLRSTQVIPLRNTKHQCVQFKEDVHFKRPLNTLDTTRLQNER